MPDFVSHTALLRGNGYLLQPEPVDINVALAHMLSLPGSEAQSRLLHALMLCDDITPEEIARICGYDVDVIRLHDSLFWNVLDRKQDLSVHPPDLREEWSRPALAQRRAGLFRRSASASVPLAAG